MAVHGFTYYGDEVRDLWDALYIDEVWHIIGSADEILAVAEQYRDEHGTALFGRLNPNRLDRYGLNYLYFDDYTNEWRILPFGAVKAIRQMEAEAHADDIRGI